MDTLVDVLALDPKEWHPQWGEIDKIVRFNPIADLLPFQVCCVICETIFIQA